jgi:hypothetical protein
MRVKAILGIIILTLIIPAVGLTQSGPNGPILVGRVSEIEGQLLRYVPDNKDWAATAKDTPFGLNDSLYSGENSRAEFVMPNSTLIRIGANTQVQLLKLEADATEIDVASGIARFYNKGSNGVVKCTTPIGDVIADINTVFDIYVGDASVEVVAVQGKVDFIHKTSNAKYDVIAGSNSIVADNTVVSAGEGTTNSDWNVWNEQQDVAWNKRLTKQGASGQYLPPGLQSEAYALEENGRWEPVSYEGQNRYMWRPTYVDPGWSPFTVGGWSTYYGDQYWVPAEPFGYVTHHYGNWIFIDSLRCWYWAPR